MVKDKSNKKSKKGAEAVEKKLPKETLPKDVKEKAKTKPISSKAIIGSISRSEKKSTAKVEPVKSVPPPQDTSEESSEESSEEEKPKPTKANGQVPVVKPSSGESSSDSSSGSEGEKPKAAQVKATASKVASALESEDSSSSEDDEDDPAPKPATATHKVAQVKNTVSKAAKQQESSDSSSSDDSDDESLPKPTPQATVVKASGSSDTSDSSDSSGSSGEKAKSESISDSDSSDEDKDAEMADVTVPSVTNGKRKAVDDTARPIKKAKTDSTHGDAQIGEIKTIFVGQLSWNVDNDWLANEFADVGEVVAARVQMDRQSGRSRGFGYVEFKTAAAAQLAVDQLQGKEIDGRAVKIDLSAPRQPNPAARAKQFGDVPGEPSSTLFVGNISWNTTEDMLWEHFGQYGEISSIRVPTDRETGKPKGFGYVEFSSIESAKKGYEGASGSELDGRYIRLDYSQPRDSSGGGSRRGDYGGKGGGRGFGDRGGRGGGRGRGSDRGGRGGRGGGRGASRGGARTGGITSFEGKKTTFD